MSADTMATRKMTRAEKRAVNTKNRLTSPWASLIAIIIAVFWTIPTLGLLVTSFRPEDDINANGWWTALFNPAQWSHFTLDNYGQALTGSSTSFGDYFVNSLVITLPAVIIPIAIALLASYAFAWMDFRGKNVLFVAVFALQIVPIQVTLIPLLRQYSSWKITGSFWPIWLSHTMFALPLAVFLLHNFMREVPSSLIEAARVDGAGHVTIFFRLMMPLLGPAIASFAIFQFLWVWNDLLVALVFGSKKSVAPLTVRVAELVGSRGTDWYLLAPGAFIAMIVPVAIFLLLQRYFVRGLLAGSVKG